MKYAEIKDITDAELAGKLTSERANLQKLRMTHAISTLENTGVLKASRKVIAQLMTEQNRRKA